MALISRPPQRVVCDASNKPASSATAFDLSATGVTGFLLPGDAQSDAVSGESYIWLAEEIDADGNPSGAWQTFEGVYTDTTTDTISQVTLIKSSTGSFIDWSATGVDANARISAIWLPQQTMEFVQSATASASSSVDFTDLEAGYIYFVDFSNITPATDAVSFQMRTSTDNGSTFDSGASDYARYYQGRFGAAGGEFGGGDSTSDAIRLAEAQYGTGANEKHSGKATVYNPNTATFTEVTFETMGRNMNADYVQFTGGGLRTQATAVDAIRFMMSSGNIASGTLTLWRRRV